MDTTQLTLILSALTALFALISPWITAIITNHAAYKKQSAQLFFQAKLESYQTYLSVTSSISCPLNAQDTKKLIDASSRAMVFSDDVLQKAISSYTSTLLSCPAQPSDLDIQDMVDAKADLIFAMQSDLKSFR